MKRRVVTLTDGTLKTRRDLVVEGRRLVIHDLRVALRDPRLAEGSDRELAQRHQEIFCRGILGCQPNTYFKTQAVRAYNGWDQRRKNRLMGVVQAQRQRIMHGVILPTCPTETGNGTPPGAGGGFGLRKRGEADRRVLEPLGA